MKEKYIPVSVDAYHELQRELAEAREQRDRLAEAASRLADVAEENTDDGDLWQTVIANVRALQSLTPTELQRLDKLRFAIATAATDIQDIAAVKGGGDE
jgi:hypothetical protein